MGQKVSQGRFERENASQGSQRRSLRYAVRGCGAGSGGEMLATGGDRRRRNLGNLGRG